MGEIQLDWLQFMLVAPAERPEWSLRREAESPGARSPIGPPLLISCEAAGGAEHLINPEKS